MRFTASANASQSASLRSSQRAGIDCKSSAAALPRGRSISHTPSSLTMKKNAACALSALGAARPATSRNIVPNSREPSGRMVGPSCMTAPVMEVEAIRIASSSAVNGEGALPLSYGCAPWGSDTPWATRRVRRSCSAEVSG